MTLMHLLPEWTIGIGLFLSLVVISFRVLTTGILIPAIASFSLLSLGYFLSRSDLSHFDSLVPMIRSDSLSYFGRLLALLLLSVFTVAFHFHRDLSMRDKQRAALFLLFQAFFVCGLFMAQSLVLFLGAALGIYFCSMHLVLIESRGAPYWLRVFRFKSVSLGVWLVLGLMLFVLSGWSFGTLFIDEWFGGKIQMSGPEWARGLLTLLVVLVGVLPLAGLRFIGEAPVGLAILSFGQMLVLQAYWFRVGIPFLHEVPVLEKEGAQLLLSLVFGGITLRAAFHLVRTRSHHVWVSSLFPVLVGLSLFSVILPSEKALVSFHLITLSFLFTFPLIAHAFLDRGYRFKGLMILSLISAVGAPPLVMGERFYRLIHQIIESGAIAAGILMTVVWFSLALASFQMIGKVLLARVPRVEQRKIDPGELFFLFLFVFGIAALTIFQGPLVELLNEHPPLNLW